MTKIENVYFDMDGVLADFHKAALTACGIIDTVDFPKGNYDITEYLEMSRKEFWDIVDGCGDYFWSSMPAVGEGINLFNDLSRYHPVIVTSPSMDPACAAGKTQWIQKYFGNNFRNYILCPAKHKKLLANPKSLLIDDRLSTFQDFKLAGGFAYHWPALSNEVETPVEQAAEDVKEYLKKYGKYE